MRDMDYTDALMDLRLKAFVPAVLTYIDKQDTLKHLERRLSTYGVGSPRIKNQYEAFYQQSPQTAGDSKATKMIMEKIALENEIVELRGFINATLDMLQVLTESELDLVEQYYDIGRTALQIGESRGVSKDTIRRDLVKIREKMTLC